MLLFWLGWFVAVGWKMREAGRRLLACVPIASASLALLFILYAPIQWNVLDDEADISSTALVLRDMHLYATVDGAVFPNAEQSSLEHVSLGHSKRPGALATLVAFLGYFHWHPFLNAYVNACGVVIFVLSLTEIGRQSGYSFLTAAMGSVGLLLLPLTGLVFSSGGLEALYLVFIFQSFVWLRGWLVQPDYLRALGLTASVALLLHTRYEAILWLPVFVLFACRQHRLPWSEYRKRGFVLLSGVGPSLMLALMNLRTHAVLEQKAWLARGLAGMTGTPIYFSWSRFLVNVTSLPDLYTKYSSAFPSDPLLTYVGVGSLIWLLIRPPLPGARVLFAFGGCLVACLFLLLPYHGASFQSSVNWRLHAPIQVGLYLWFLLGLDRLRTLRYPTRFQALRIALPSVLALGMILRPLSTSWKNFQVAAPEARALMQFVPTHRGAVWVSSFPVRFAPFLVPVVNPNEAESLRRPFVFYSEFFAHWSDDSNPNSGSAQGVTHSPEALFDLLNTKGHWTFFWDDPEAFEDFSLKKVEEFPDAGSDRRLAFYQWMVVRR